MVRLGVVDWQRDMWYSQQNYLVGFDQSLLNLRYLRAIQGDYNPPSKFATQVDICQNKTRDIKENKQM